jgi:hypothetical protein
VQKYWKECLDKVRSGEVDPTFLITDTGTLADAPLYYEKMANQESIKLIGKKNEFPKKRFLIKYIFPIFFPRLVLRVKNRISKSPIMQG